MICGDCDRTAQIKIRSVNNQAKSPVIRTTNCKRSHNCRKLWVSSYIHITNQSNTAKSKSLKYQKGGERREQTVWLTDQSSRTPTRHQGRADMNVRGVTENNQQHSETHVFTKYNFLCSQTFIQDLYRKILCSQFWNCKIKPLR